MILNEEVNFHTGILDNLNEMMALIVLLCSALLE
tara:strand:- start:505 stop:606 length:102 start_codon:yes stop_codon:yes gene_type:complete